MDYPALADVVVQCIDERAIPLLFTEGGCMQLLYVKIRGAAEIYYGDSFVNLGDSYPIRLPSTQITHALGIIQWQIFSTGDECCWDCA